MSDMDTVLSQLREVEETLASLPEDAFEERAELQARQRDLRAQAAKAREEMAEPRPDRDDESDEDLQVPPDRTIPIVIGAAVLVLIALVVIWIAAVGTA